MTDMPDSMRMPLNWVMRFVVTINLSGHHLFCYVTSAEVIAVAFFTGVDAAISSSF